MFVLELTRREGNFINEFQSALFPKSVAINEVSILMII